VIGMINNIEVKPKVTPTEVTKFKQMVNSLHHAGIAVLLPLVS
jgi:pullulanase/glycogen debranching enzyme